MIPHPSFVVYPMIVQAVGGIRVVVTLKDYRLDLEAMARAITPMTKMVFIANPNNPTATIVTADEVEHFMARVPDQVIVVFDEAYIEFAQGPDFPDTLAYLRQGRKVVVLRTFSKAASLAGLRVGYAVADPDCIALLNRIRQPFNVNSLAQVAALAALDDDSHVLECVRMIEAGRHYLYDEFTALGSSTRPRAPTSSWSTSAAAPRDVYPAAAQGRRDRPADDELRDGVGAARHHRHARGEPAIRQGPPEGAGGRTRVIRAAGDRRRRTPGRLGGQGGASPGGWRARSSVWDVTWRGCSPPWPTARSTASPPAWPTGVRRRRRRDPGRHRARQLTRCYPRCGRRCRRAPASPTSDRTKRSIVREAERLGAERGDVHFVGSHPMAGSEKSGYGFARGDLFERATVVVTPTKRGVDAATGTVSGLWRTLGARVVVWDAEGHDRAVAAISHLPHVVAWALVDAVDRYEPAALDLVAGGFRDTTRIAASDPVVWREILLANRDEVAVSLGAFREALADLERLIAEADPAALERYLARVKALREAVR